MMSNKKQIPDHHSFEERLRILCQQALANTRHLQQLCNDASNHRLPPLPSTRQPFIDALTRKAANNLSVPLNDLQTALPEQDIAAGRDSKLSVTKIVFDRKSLQRIRGRAPHQSISLRNRLNNNTIFYGRNKSKNDLHKDIFVSSSKQSQQGSVLNLAQHLKATQSKPQSIYPSIFIRHSESQHRRDQQLTSRLSTLYSAKGGDSKQILTTIRDTLYGKGSMSARKAETLDLRTISIYNQDLVMRRRKKPERKQFGSLQPWQRQPEEELLFDY